MPIFQEKGEGGGGVAWEEEEAAIVDDFSSGTQIPSFTRSFIAPTFECYV